MDSPTPIPHRGLLAGLLAALAMLGPFCIDAIFPAFPAIARRFDAGAVAMQQTISVYLFAYAALSLFVGAMSDAWGRRAIILVGLVVFFAGTVGCALAPSMQALLVFRALQGMSAGIGMIVGRAIVRDCFEGPHAQKLMAQISLIFGLAPALAPVVGAWLVAWDGRPFAAPPAGLVGWHALFWALALFTLALIGLCLAVLPETHARDRRVAFLPGTLFANYRGIITDHQFVALALALTFNSAGFFVYIANAPTFVLGILKLDQNHFPWLFVPAISGLMLGALLTSRLAGRVPVRTLVGAGYVVMLGASLLNLVAAFAVQPARVPWTVLPIAIGAIGVNLVAPALNLLVLDRFPAYRGGASSVQAFLMLTFSALLAGVLGPLLARSAPSLAITSSAFYLIGLIGWRWYRHIARRIPEKIDGDAAVIAVAGANAD
ncbi:MAG: multidrug effflux MFS transporter [Proteobacteria bacterium]|nr:multidrug effflux MFS transporter [Pseudomonadota bacterium]